MTRNVTQMNILPTRGISGLMEDYGNKKKESGEQQLEEDHSISDLLKEDFKLDDAKNRSVHSTNIPGLNRGKQ